MPSSRAVSTRMPPQVGAERIGGRDVRRLRALVERVLAPVRAVDELVADDELAELEVGLQRARRVRADDPPDAELLHRPDVRAVVDLRGRQLVRAAVPRQERDALAADVADRDGRRRRAVRRVDRHLLDVVEQRVEAAAAEDADLRVGHAASRRQPACSSRRRSAYASARSRAPAVEVTQDVAPRRVLRVSAAALRSRRSRGAPGRGPSLRAFAYVSWPSVVTVERTRSCDAELAQLLGELLRRERPQPRDRLPGRDLLGVDLADRRALREARPLPLGRVRGRHRQQLRRRRARRRPARPTR